MVLVVADRASERPAEIALRDRRMTLRWGEVDETANRIADALSSLVLGAERRVGVFAHNSAETVLAYLGITHAGCSAVPVNFHLTTTEVAYILADANAEVLFVGPETAAVGLEAARQAGVRLVVGWRCAEFEGVTDWAGWLAAASGVEPPAERAVLPSLMYTSGTTGFPKGVELMTPYGERGDDTLAGFAESVRGEKLASYGNHLVVGPMYHTGPIRCVRVLAAGTPVIVQDRFDAEGVLAAIERFQIATCLLVPTHFVRLLALADEVRSRYDVSSIRHVVHTGSACPVDVKRRMIDWWGPVFVEGYGSTESRMLCMIDSAEWLRRPGSVGRVVPPYRRAFTVGADGAELPAGEVGVLYFEDSTGRGIVYRDDPEKTRAAHRAPGVFTMGDVGYVDPDGYVFVTDRVADMVISGGVNIYPAEAELALATHPDVEDVVVIGIPDVDLGETVHAIVVPRADACPAEAELIAYCRSHLAGYKCPRSVEFARALERSPMGKVAKHKIRARYWAERRAV